MKLIFELILLFFAVFGICECCLQLGSWITRRYRARCLRRLTIVARLGEGDDPEFVARVLLRELQGLRDSDGNAACVVLLDDGLTDDGRAVCGLLCSDDDRVTLCRPEDMSDRI